MTASLTSPQWTWINALLSGKYKQSKHPYANMREDDGFTACGVLCELAVRAKVIREYDPNQAMPTIVQRWVGLRGPFPPGFDLDSGTFEQTANMLKRMASDVFSNAPAISRCKATLTEAQRSKLRELYKTRNHEYQSYLEFRRNVIGTFLKGEPILAPMRDEWVEIRGDGTLV